MPIPFAGCWMWMKSIGSHGYGQATLPDKRVTVAHRVSFEAFKGPIPAGKLIQHSCDSRWCVNPDHLSIGTDKTNAIDKQIKGRASKKLSPESVLAIRGRLALGHAMLKIARDFDVHPRLIANIRDGKSWSHV